MVKRLVVDVHRIQLHYKQCMEIVVLFSEIAICGCYGSSRIQKYQKQYAFGYACENMLH